MSPTLRLIVLVGCALLWASDAAAADALSLVHSGDVDQDFLGRLRCAFGCVAMVGLAAAFSERRRAIPWRLVAIGTALQLAFAVLVLLTPFGAALFAATNEAVNVLLSYSDRGARFLFGNLVDNNVPVGKPLHEPATLAALASSELWARTGTMFAFRVLPTILFFSALTALCYHLGILQAAVRGIAWVMQRTLRTSGAESLSVASNIFLGQTEAPLLVKPYLPRMTRSELMAVMTAGFATVAGGVLAAYVGMLHSTFPDIAGHLLASSVMCAPSSFVMAKIMVPETSTPETGTSTRIEMETVDQNVLDATARGTTEGITLMLNVGAMLIVFVALIALVNGLLGGIGGSIARALVATIGDGGAAQFFASLSLDGLFALVGAPFAFVLGVPWSDAAEVGALLGTKTAINEFVAYQQLADALAAGKIEHGKSVVIAAYALCGFSNFASIGIQIGGLSAMAPSRRADVAALGMRAMLCGSLATFQTAAIAGMFL